MSNRLQFMVDGVGARVESARVESVRVESVSVESVRVESVSALPCSFRAEGVPSPRFTSAATHSIL